jgi:Pao retrotransposon peptidase
MWRGNKNKEMAVYQLDTVTFGTTPAAFMATRSLLETARYTDDNTLAPAIRSSFYVDDMLFLHDNLSEIKKITVGIYNHLDKFGMNLTKIMASNPAVITSFDTNRLSEDAKIQYCESLRQKTLGLKWNLHEDALEIGAPKTNHPKITKRHILADMALLFDPLRYATPTIRLAKLTFSDICKGNWDWDVKRTGEIRKKWLTARNHQIDSHGYLLQRHIPAAFCCLVPLSDVSPKVYSFAMYLANSDFLMHLIRAKTQMIPTKTVKVPWAKLRGAILLESCLATTIKAINRNIKPEKVYVFTDSKILLE